ncbi:lachesin-like [Brevipalpus obovatus]|uniref:lachesin-like n=1 Tax=Brevipalpus obovatus TaxID=246614 RepID=UPI003D9E5B05
MSVSERMYEKRKSYLLIFCHLLTLFVDLINGQQEPAISFISKEKIASLGESIELICETAYASGNSVQWIKANEGGITLLSTGNTVSIPDDRIVLNNINEKFKLRIDRIVENDKGRYLCRIQMPTKTIEASVNVTVRIPPVITDDSSRHVVTSVNASEIILKCNATGHPEPRISWRREKHRLLPNKRAFLLGNILNITNITKDHQGTYFCVADNGVGGDRRAISIEVEYPPSIRLIKDRVGQALNYNQDLVCSVESFPSAAISWYKEDDPFQALSNNKNYNISIFPTNNEFVSTTILRVRRIEKRNFGRFFCQASNKLGTVKGYIELFETQNVICPPDCSPLYSPYNSSPTKLPSFLTYFSIFLTIFLSSSLTIRI